jgi:single-stranded-DNA-specific exonuclease
MEMIISDHHEPSPNLPEVGIVICPKQEGDTYPEKNLAGVGVAYKIAEALVSQRPLEGYHLNDVLDLVAVGTVADLVPLIGENRSLVQAGLETLRSGRRQGLFSLMQAANLDVQRVNAGNIGFVIGPRINAAGRLDQANPALELLLSDDLLKAGFLAQQLDDLNRERKQITQWIQDESEVQARADGDDFLLFAAHKEFNEGVVGLAASRLTESYYRPSVVGHRGPELTRASCRSIPEFHITQALDECAELLVRHGGHAMAAGFTVRNENLDELMSRLKEIARQELEGQELCPELKADVELALRDLHPEILELIDMIEPTGHKNPPARFVSRSLRVTNCRQVGQDRQHLKLTVTDGTVYFDAIAFRQGHWYGQMPEYVDMLYSYEKNEFNGRVSLQLNVKDIKPSGQED